MDGHTSHESADVLQLLKDEHIMAIEIIAHSSHILQPLDRAFFRSMKSNLKKDLASIRRRESPSDGTSPSLVQNREWMIRAARSALQRSATTEIIRNGFRVAGIFPFDSALPLQHETLADTVPKAPPPRKKRSQIKIGEEVMTSDHVIAAIRAREQVQAARRGRGKIGHRQIRRVSDQGRVESDAEDFCTSTPEEMPDHHAGSEEGSSTSRTEDETRQIQPDSMQGKRVPCAVERFRFSTFTK